MAKDTSIKAINRKWIIGYTVAHLILFGILLGLVNPELETINELAKKFMSPGGIVALIGFPLSKVLEGIISSRTKASLVFWKVKNPMPGTQAFSKIAPKDSRISNAALNELFPAGIPEDPESQNAEWYKLYSNTAEEAIVFDSHRSFLLTRDLCAITLLLIPIISLAHCLMGTTWNPILTHIGILSGLFLLISISSQNYGKRFVANVIVKSI